MRRAAEETQDEETGHQLDENGKYSGRVTSTKHHVDAGYLDQTISLKLQKDLASCQHLKMCRNDLNDLEACEADFETIDHHVDHLRTKISQSE